MKKINIEDCLYPKKLKKISKPPICLYTEGNLNLLNSNSIAIIGSRAASESGITLAKNFAKELSQIGITIISGLARGIDTAAHKGSYNQFGKTIAVLGGGFNHIYPPENLDLYIALPHEIGNSHGVGTNRLIKNGAILTTETEDILNALKLVEYKEKFLNLKNSNYSKIKKDFSDPMQSIIFRFINNTPISANDLSRRTGYTINEILSTLFILEMNGYIKKVSGGYITCT